MNNKKMDVNGLKDYFNDKFGTWENYIKEVKSPKIQFIDHFSLFSKGIAHKVTEEGKKNIDIISEYLKELRSKLPDIKITINEKKL